MEFGMAEGYNKASKDSLEDHGGVVKAYNT